MLSTISWQNYITLLAWLLAGWYCYVAVVYYSKDIKRMLQLKGAGLHWFNKNSDHRTGNHTNDAFTMVQNLRDNIALVLHHAARHRFSKEELLMALQVSVRQFPQLRQSPFAVAINDYIMLESEKQCSTTFSEEEVRLVWME